MFKKLGLGNTQPAHALLGGAWAQIRSQEQYYCGWQVTEANWDGVAGESLGSLGSVHTSEAPYLPAPASTGSRNLPEASIAGTVFYY